MGIALYEKGERPVLWWERGGHEDGIGHFCNEDTSGKVGVTGLLNSFCGSR